MFFLQEVFLVFTILEVIGNNLFSYLAKDLNEKTVSLTKYAEAKFF